MWMMNNRWIVIFCIVLFQQTSTKNSRFQIKYWIVWYMYHLSASSCLHVDWTFFARCYGWSTTSENRLKIGVLQGVGQYLPNFRIKGDRVRPIPASGTRYRLIPPVLIRDRYLKKCFDTSTDTRQTSHLCNEKNRPLFWLHTSKKEADRLRLNVAVTGMQCTAIDRSGDTATNSPILWSHR